MWSSTSNTDGWDKHRTKRNLFLTANGTQPGRLFFLFWSHGPSPGLTLIYLTFSHLPYYPSHQTCLFTLSQSCADFTICQCFPFPHRCMATTYFFFFRLRSDVVSLGAEGSSSGECGLFKAHCHCLFMYKSLTFRQELPRAKSLSLFFAPVVKSQLIWWNTKGCFTASVNWRFNLGHRLW